MSEENLFEEDIWEYKSIRKSKLENSDASNSVLKARDSKYKSKRCKIQRNKRTVEVKGKSKNDELCLGERSSQTLVSDPNLSGGDNIQQSQGKVTTKAKFGKTNKKLTPTKQQPVYSGYCPSCQMPFSLLLGQTPRWHVSECLDAPQSSERECPDGLLCTSTNPSHYTRYAHFLLAQSRAGNVHFSSPTYMPNSKLIGSNDTKSGFLCSLEERWTQCQKQTENAKNDSTDPLLITLSPRKFQSPTETNKKISLSTNGSKSQQTLQFTEFVDNDRLESSGLPLADGELDRQNSSEHLNLPLPEADLSDCEISFSPLQSDEETYDIEEKLEDSQKELFIAENSENYGIEDEDDSCILFRRLCRTLQEKYEPNCQKMNSYINRNEYDEELNIAHSLSDLSKPISQNNERIKFCEPACATNHFKCFPTSLAEELNSTNYQVNKEGPDESKLFSSQSSRGNMPIEESAACNRASQQLLHCKMSKSLESKEEKTFSLCSTQSEIVEKSNRSFYGKSNSRIINFCQEELDSKPSTKASILEMETFPNKTTAHISTEILLPCAPSSNTRPSSTKVLKQMDIGVFFGLPPKAKEEKTPEKSASKRTKNESPNEKLSGQSKRKREGSLGNLELDIQDLNRTKTSVESPHEESQRRKRFRKSSTVEKTQMKKTDELMNNRELVTNKVARGGSQRWRTKLQDSFSTTEGGLRKKKCPFYKKIPGTGFTVDAFQYGAIEGCTAYFLTHFHSDHYAGLSKKFTFPVYCSKITSNLVKSKLCVQEQYLHPLPMDTVCIVNDIKVVLLDANHCPGAVMILFYLPNGTVILHTGDFRADPSMERYSLLANQKVHTLYLDTTYCSPEYTFPSQQEVIQFAINIAFESVTLAPRTLVVCGTYAIGKEKVFLAIADVLGSKVSMSQEKYKTLKCLELQEVNSLITTDWNSALVHLLPMMQINFKDLQNHLNKCGGKYDCILAFRPTGWTHSEKFDSITDIVPQTKGNISIYGIPYSEHSSYVEMKRFVQWLKPQKIISTVNVGSWESRKTMQKYFNEWKHEAGY
ncbi:DNA cross-link repair 1A protein isoform X1 [Monodelphis domestica]|uniref:DNA cross-link repair 1A protein isoform X1 n=1 Tax=Monodelphis domestica TaxID=13616 RepID=UPI0000D930A6|nr:DNA cross-link repair 1A protein isoform X1 [Monodelphis domestica]XP_016279800.1 DNA cross-link repair 1A protein isoform X1 [Monodelphis domestica]